MAGRTEGRPGDVEPAGAGQELVGQGMMTQEVDQALELLRVLGADVGGAALLVLRATDTTHAPVHVGIAESAVDDDGAADGFAGGLQQLAAAVDHVGNLQDVGDVLGILVEVTELAHGKVN